MKLKALLFFCVLLSLFASISSCVKDSDMGVKDVIDPSSIVTSNLLVTSLNASDFMDESTNQERAIRIDTSYLELTNTTFMMDQLAQTNLTFKLKNSIERAFKIDVEFMNDLNEVKYALQIPVSSGTKQKPITVETNVIIEIPELATFKEATKFMYKIALIPGDSQLVSETDGTLELQSDATYFLDF